MVDHSITSCRDPTAEALSQLNLHPLQIFPGTSLYCLNGKDILIKQHDCSHLRPENLYNHFNNLMENAFDVEGRRCQCNTNPVQDFKLATLSLFSCQKTSLLKSDGNAGSKHGKIFFVPRAERAGVFVPQAYGSDNPTIQVETVNHAGSQSEAGKYLSFTEIRLTLKIMAIKPPHHIDCPLEQ